MLQINYFDYLCFPLGEKTAMTNSGILNLTEGHIMRQLLKLALPIMGTSFAQMAYNLLSIFWVGHLGSQTIAAVGSVAMLMWLVTTIALLAKIASEITIGQSVGAKKYHKAFRYASHTTTLALTLGVILAVLLFVFADGIISFFKLSDDITSHAATYLRIITSCVPCILLSHNFSGIYNGAGRSSVPFRLNATGLVLNMVLDPIFIFGIGFIPEMGMFGAAWGTVVAQYVVVIAFLWRLKRKEVSFGNFPLLVKPQWGYMLRIIKLGTPVSVMNALYALINMTLARVAALYNGHIGLMSQTTGGQIEGVTWNSSQGFSTALGAFVAQNYAAGRLERARKAYFFTVLVMGVFGLFVSFSFVFAGGPIFSLFVNEDRAIFAGAQYLAIVGLSQIFMMSELTTQGMFNGVGRTVPPAVISISFNALRIPLAYFLAERMGILGVWWAIAISTMLKGIILPVWFSFIYKGILYKKQK
jgi:putative MATE family efflux protein